MMDVFETDDQSIMTGLYDMIRDSTEPFPRQGEFRQNEQLNSLASRCCRCLLQDIGQPLKSALC
ncbi:hypothetical protein D7U74_03220 [Stenotrophomonas maltophilia]|nr:hypothetical protein [Stenotrophomonas maltophilia]